MQDDAERQTANFAETKKDFSDQVGEAGKKAADVLDRAKADLASKATDVASESKEVLVDQAEAVQSNLSSAMAAFGGAMRAASEHLNNNQQRAASRFVLDAAGGLERLSRSLKEKPFEDVLSEIRSFGTRNPGALVGGSVVAGLALGRFIKSSSPSPEDKNSGDPKDASSGATWRPDTNTASSTQGLD